jgi:two-component system phosphate regulon sensor histidine kinase PhoR
LVLLLGGWALYERYRRQKLLKTLAQLTGTSNWKNTLQSWAAQNKYPDSTKTETFLAELAHELKTPIAILIGYLDTLSQGAWKDETVAPTFLQKALLQAQRLAALTQDVLFLAQIESGGWQLQLEPVPLEALSQTVWEELEPLAQRKHIRLEIQASDRGIAVEADATALRLILKNLVENAIQYSPEGRRVWIGWQVLGSQVRIEVGDEGIGIPAEELPRIFDRFYRVDKSRSRAHGGTGLGLTLVRELLQAHHSTIQVRSEVGKGSVFWFELPLAG